MSLKALVSLMGGVAAAPSFRLMDFPMTGECTEPTTNLTGVISLEVSSGDCSGWKLATCGGIVAGATAACDGPKDLPCIARVLAATGGCGSCVCALIHYDCYHASSDPLAEFGTCEEVGYTQLQDTRNLEEEGMDVVVLVFSKPDEPKQLLHVLDVPEEGLCSQMSLNDALSLPSNATVAPGSCVEVGFDQFDSFGTYVAHDHYGIGGCSGWKWASCAGLASAAVVACGGPEDIPCLAATLSMWGGCGVCVCKLFHCGSTIPVEVYAPHGDELLQV